MEVLLDRIDGMIFAFPFGYVNLLIDFLFKYEKKIAILGSTGSIGKTLLKIIEKDKKNFEIVLLTANKNYKNLLKQAKKFNVKNLIIKNKESFKKAKKKKKKKN